MILWFQAGSNIVKIKVEGKKISVATMVHGLAYYFPIETSKTSKLFNEEEKTKFDALRNEAEVIESVKRDMMEQGYKFVGQKEEDKI